MAETGNIDIFIATQHLYALLAVCIMTRVANCCKLPDYPE